MSSDLKVGVRIFGFGRFGTGAIYYEGMYRYDRVREDGKRENCQDDYYEADMRRLSKEEVW